MAVDDELEATLEHASDTALTLYDLIMALLRGDISHEEAIEFLALDKEKIENHKHTNKLIKFNTPKDKE